MKCKGCKYLKHKWFKPYCKYLNKYLSVKSYCPEYTNRENQLQPTRYIITLLLTVSICATLYLSSAQKYHEWEITLQNKDDTILSLTEQVDMIGADNAKLLSQLDTLSTQIDTQFAQINTLREEVKQHGKVDRGGDRTRYNLTDSERDLVERVVMAEVEDEPYEGKILVCQCILNACRINNKRPAEIIKQYVYAKRRPEPSESVKKAVAAVFDKGETVTDEAVIYFYAPALVKSEFHESQRFVCEVGGHRFFSEG